MRARAAVVRPALPAALVEKFEGANVVANAVVIGTLGPRQREVVRLAYVQGLRNMWVMYAVVVGLGLVAGAFITERTLSETYVGVEIGAKAPLDAEGVKLRGMAVEGMAVEVEPAVP